MASAYSAASVSVLPASPYVGTYTNTMEGGASKTAYYFSPCNLYTTRGSLDVYLDPTNPITVSYTATPGKALDSALRVGVAVGGVMEFIYAPAAESEVGNSLGSTARFLAVNAAGTATAQSTLLTDMSSSVLTSLSDYQAVAVPGTRTSIPPARRPSAPQTTRPASTSPSTYGWKAPTRRPWSASPTGRRAGSASR